MTADLKKFHSQFPDSLKWRLTTSGIEVQGEGILRTLGKPLTIKKIWDSYGASMTSASIKYNVPIEIIFALIAGESAGNPKAIREEPGFISDEKTPDRVSPGLTQTLISTARQVLKNPNLTRVDLFNPDTAIRAGTGYVAMQKGKTGLDPVLVAAAYNSGGVYYQKGEQNKFKLRVYPIGTSRYIEKFILWFNDASWSIGSGYIQTGQAVTYNKLYP